MTSMDRSGVLDGGGAIPRRAIAETKSAFKTTELYIYLLSVAGVMLASFLVGDSDGHGDYFRADLAWLYTVILTSAYLVSRGLAKCGSSAWGKIVHHDSP